MTQPRPTETLPPPRLQHEPGYRVANALSYTFNPLALPSVGFGLIVWHFGGHLLEIAWAVLGSAIFFCAIPLAFVVYLVRRGEAQTLEVREQGSRSKPFAVGIASYAVGIAVLWATLETARPLVVALAALYPLNTAVLALINLRWKISIHMASLAGFVAILVFVAATAWRGLPDEAALTVLSTAPLLALVPLLMWARVRVGAHTPGQVLAGTAFGLLVPPIELYALAHGVLGLVG